MYASRDTSGAIREDEEQEVDNKHSFNRQEYMIVQSHNNNNQSSTWNAVAIILTTRMYKQTNQ